MLFNNPNYREPVPNTDPNYVPTAPSISRTTISAKGKVQLTFSEDVWIVDNLKNATYLSYVGPSKLRRELQEFEELPYIDVSIELGDPENESTDLSDLDFDYDAFFVDARTIELGIRFVSPVYVSTNQPEDMLVIKF